MTFFIDGNRMVNVADSHVGLSMTLSEHEGLKLNISSWSHDVLHVIAQTMAACGDRGIPITISTANKNSSFAWGLLFYGYSTGETYENSTTWIRERAQEEINESDEKWLAVKSFLWP